MTEILERAIILFVSNHGFIVTRKALEKEYNISRDDAISFCEMALEQIETEHLDGE
jgi:hypothetical protein